MVWMLYQKWFSFLKLVDEIDIIILFSGSCPPYLVTTPWWTFCPMLHVKLLCEFWVCVCWCGKQPHLLKFQKALFRHRVGWIVWGAIGCEKFCTVIPKHWTQPAWLWSNVASEHHNDNLCFCFFWLLVRRGKIFDVNPFKFISIKAGGIVHKNTYA